MYAKFSTIVLFLIGSSILFNFAILNFGENEVDNTPEQEGIAVIELFTSQGCSSCPSADRLLSQLIDEAEMADQPVYGLSFHVDYWNRLGWKDPYSEKAFTERQYAYARQMGKRGVYTPQMVVNGKAEFVGSDRRLASREIEKASKKIVTSDIKVTAFKIDNNQLTFSYESTTASPNNWLIIALVERGIATQVKRGENGGRLLKHDNVVRNFNQEVSKRSNEHSLQLPADLDLNMSSLILYSQNKSTLEIESATRISLAQLADDSKN